MPMFLRIIRFLILESWVSNKKPTNSIIMNLNILNDFIFK